MANETTKLSPLPARQSFSRLLLDLGMPEVKRYDEQCQWWTVESRDLDDAYRVPPYVKRKFVDLELIPFGADMPLALIESCRWDEVRKVFVIGCRKRNEGVTMEYSVETFRKFLGERTIVSIRLWSAIRSAAEIGLDFVGLTHMYAMDIGSLFASPFRKFRKRWDR
ncbi:MAG TPA: hypothetical protein VN420_00240 [Candidatus Fimivivens sp.]|nr:hypothetical protein [Candidatus Fimivivens sp.]